MISKSESLFTTILRKEGFLFGILVLIETLLILFMVLGHRIPRPYDGFQYFSLQYYYLNNATIAGEIPIWVPFMTHGMVGNWVHDLQAGILQNALLLFGWPVKNANFLPIFYLGIWFDHLLLLTGSWMLARVYFKEPTTRFFTVAAIGGSTIWMNQPWWNFHSYYALPLILFLGHRFISRGSCFDLFLAGNLTALQILGNVPYLIPFQTFVIALYFSLYLSFFHQWNTLRNQLLKKPVQLVSALLPAMASFLIVFVLLKHGTDEIVNFTPGRGADGTVPLAKFLTYAGNLNANLWNEVLFRNSPGLDYTLYFGFGSLLFVLIGVIIPKNRMFWVLASLSLLIIWFSLGDFFATEVYYTWPMMKYFRHLSLVSPVARLFLCFSSGFGFESLFDFLGNQWSFPQKTDGAKKSPVFFILIFFGIFLMGWAVALICLALNPTGAMAMLKNFPAPQLGISVFSMKEKAVVLQLVLAACFSAGWGILFLIMRPRSTSLSCIASLVILFQAMDLYGYKLQQILIDTVPLDPIAFHLNDFQKMPYPAFREDRNFHNERKTIMQNAFPLEKDKKFTWIDNAYFFSDPLEIFGRVDYWLKPFDNLSRSLWGQGMRETAIRPKGFVDYSELIFPSDKIAVPKITGSKIDKIQCFEDAFSSPSIPNTSSLLGLKDDIGDVLFINDPDSSSSNMPAVSYPKDFLKMNRRDPLKYRLLRFDANHLDLSLNLAGIHDPSKGPWLVYCDIWHPFWKATVNGEPTKIFRANLAYKAIRVPVGKSEIHFTCQSSLLASFFWMIGLESLFWVGFVVWMATRQNSRFPSQPETISILPLGSSPNYRKLFYIPVVAGLTFLGLLCNSSAKDTMLIVALVNNNLALAKSLLWLGANPNAKDTSGMTPLLYATATDHKKLFDLLHHYGASLESRDSYGRTIWIIAVDKGDFKMARSLSALLPENPSNLNSPDIFGRTYLHYATFYADNQKLRAMLKNGANPNVQNQGGFSPLMMAAIRGRNESAKALLDFHANPDLVNVHGQTALVIALSNNNTEIAKILCESGADVNLADQEGMNPLLAATFKGNVEMAKTLLQRGVSVDHPNNKGQTAMMIASGNENLEIMSLLQAHHPDLSAKDKDGWTPLIYAEKQGCAQAVQWLLQHGAKPVRASSKPSDNQKS